MASGARICICSAGEEAGCKPPAAHLRAEERSSYRSGRTDCFAYSTGTNAELENQLSMSLACAANSAGGPAAITMKASRPRIARVLEPAAHLNLPVGLEVGRQPILDEGRRPSLGGTHHPLRRCQCLAIRVAPDHVRVDAHLGFHALSWTAFSGATVILMVHLPVPAGSWGIPPASS